MPSSFERRPLSLLARLAALLALGTVSSSLGCGPPHNIFTPDTATMDAVFSETTPGDVVSEQSCSTNDDCDNHVYCDGQERCVAGHCVNPTRGACDDGHTCTTDSCDENARMCTHVADDTMCGDMHACNGIERCVGDGANVNAVTGCETVRPDHLVDCDDGNTCTLDGCDDTTGCVHAPRDLDGDGHVDRMCSIDGTPTGVQGDDCNDGDPTAYPGAPEICNDNRDNNCNGLVDLADSTSCAPGNDTCATATMLPGPGVYWASVVGLRSDYTLSCNPGAWSDAAWVFDNPSLQDVTVAIGTTDTGAGVAVVSDCDATTDTELRCAVPFGGSQPSLTLHSLPAGRYRILAETGNTSTPFRLTLRFDTATPPLYEDSCPAVPPGMNPDLADGMPHVARLAMLGDDHVLSCDTSGAHRDAVFRLTLAADADIVINATPTSAGAFTNTWLSIRSSPCNQVSSERRCVTAQTTMGAAQPAIYTAHGVPAGTYWVLVEQSNDVNVTVTATVNSPPAPRATEDACPTMGIAPAIELSDPLNATRVAALGTLEDDHVLSCSTTARRDAVYRLTLTAPSDVVLRAASGSGTTSLSVRPGDANCGVSSSERRCNVSPSAGADAVFTGRALPAGIYWVLLENSVDSSVTLTTAITTPPAPRAPDDICPPTVTSPVAELTSGSPRMSDLSVLEDDYMLSCGVANRRDAVYHLNVTATSDLRVNATASTGVGYLSLRGAGCSSGAELRCLSGNVLSPTQPATLTARDLAPGDYWVFAEQDSDRAITVTPTVTPSSARLAAEYCPGATLATDGTPSVINWGVSGTPGSIDLVPDLGTSCGSHGTNTSYRDAVLSFTLPVSSDVNVAVTSGSGTINWDMRGACNATVGPIVPCQSTSATTSRRVRGMLAGTYYLVLESLAGVGPTSVTLTATPAAPAVSYAVATAPASVTWTDACALPGAVTVLPDVDDSPQYTVPSLPFAVRVYDNVIPMTSPSVVVDSNGYLTWVPSVAGYPLGGQIPGTSAPFLVSALYWRDLYTRSSGICVGTAGTAPNRRWIVEWTDQTHCCTSTDGTHMTFELVVNEAAAGANNVIDYLYNRMDGAGDATSAGAGLENEDGTLSVTLPGSTFPAPRFLRLTPSR